MMVSFLWQGCIITLISMIFPTMLVCMGPDMVLGGPWSWRAPGGVPSMGRNLAMGCYRSRIPHMTMRY